jgi:hypothetical protein
MMVPPAIVLQISKADGTAVGAVHHVVRLAPRGRLITAAQLVATLNHSRAIYRAGTFMRSFKAPGVTAPREEARAARPVWTS